MLWVSHWPMSSCPGTLWSVGLGGIVVRALLWLFLSIPLSSKMITPKEILNCFISREDFENWIEFEYLMITPFKKKKKKKSVLEAECLGMDFTWFASKETPETIIRLCCDSSVHLFGSSSCGKGCMLFWKIDIFILGWKLSPKTLLICLPLLIFTAWWNKQ